MTNNAKLVVAAILALVVGFGLGVYGQRSSEPANSNVRGTSYDVQHFGGDVRQGYSDSLMMTGGVSVGPVGGSALATLSVSTSTTLLGSSDCSYDTILQPTSTANVVLTLPTAAKSASLCLTQDGAQEVTFIQIAAANSFGMTIATSTGDVLTWNGTSTAGGATLATSSQGAYYKLEAVRYNSSTVVYTIGNMGVGH